MSENGQDVNQQSPQVQQQVMMRELNIALHQIIENMVRGALTGAGGIPVHEVMNAIAFQMGHTLGRTLQGDIVQLINLRKGFQVAFEKGVRSTPPTPAQAPPTELVKRLNG